MTKFAFLIHPLAAKDLARKWPIAGVFPERFLEWVLGKMSPRIMSHVKGIKSLTGQETEGYFIAVPLTPHMFMTYPLEKVYAKMAAAVELAREQGVEIVGLGAFTSVVGDGGETLHKMTGMPITTGNSYTVATAIEGALDACDRVGIDRKTATLAVIGATGSIGRCCAEVMGKEFGKTILVGRDFAKTELVAKDIPNAVPTVTLDSVIDADVVVTVTSADAPVLLPEHLKQGAVICDVARPRDVSVRVAKERPDVLVIEGGVIEVPGPVDFGLDFGFPEKTAYACMSETFMLALEDRKESFTLGKHVYADQVREMQEMAKRHGFKLAGYRSFERAVSDDQIERVRESRKAAIAVAGS
ncbi:MAG: hypothetical protein KF836_11895 [Fimbriimonadaceae bacterium]|nr:hypothetical protein [Fimbriimonadaceae bacterium]